MQQISCSNSISTRNHCCIFDCYYDTQNANKIVTSSKITRNTHVQLSPSSICQQRCRRFCEEKARCRKSRQAQACEHPAQARSPRDPAPPSEPKHDSKNGTHDVRHGRDVWHQVHEKTVFAGQQSQPSPPKKIEEVAGLLVQRNIVRTWGGV